MSRIVSDNIWMQQMFDSIPDKYTLLNKIITFGQDEIWRNRAVDIINPQDGLRILDVCTGTGDFALKLASRFPFANVYAIDFSSRMLVVARRRASILGLQNIFFKENDCVDLDFPNDYFDYITISFGFRNLSYSMINLKNAVKEIQRILKHGGRFIILETSQPVNIFIRKLFHFYARRVVHVLGAFFSGEKAAYTYLGESIVKFFDREKLVSFLMSEDFQKERTISFMFGMILLTVFKK